MIRRTFLVVGLGVLSLAFVSSAQAADPTPVACHLEGTGHSEQGVTFVPKTISFSFELAVTCKASDPALQSGLLRGDGSGQLSCTGGTFAGKATVVWGGPASNRTSNFTYTGRAVGPTIEIEARIVGGTDYVGDHFNATGTISPEHPEACAGEGIHNLSFNEEATITSPPPPEVAGNSPTYRDCSLVAGLDPDFVKISGVTVGSHGTLTVPPSQNQVQLEASESSDPLDNLGHVTLTVTVTAPGVPTQTVSGAGTGKVVLSVPLASSRAGRSYTISWSATFDNGMHQCPSAQTPENTGPNPFVVTVASSPGESCHEGDGEGQIGDSQSASRTASFKFDADPCDDGAPESVSEQDPSAGTDFHSTQVQSVAFNDIAHSVTVTGLGTNKGLPVTFVMVAVDSELVPGGLYSLVLSDGYRRSGTLTSGAVKLH